MSEGQGCYEYAGAASLTGQRRRCRNVVVAEAWYRGRWTALCADHVSIYSDLPQRPATRLTARERGRQRRAEIDARVERKPAGTGSQGPVEWANHLSDRSPFDGPLGGEKV